MSRFPQIPEDELQSEQKLIREGVEKVYQRFPGIPYMDSQGKFYGPYNTLHYSPSMIKPWFDVAWAVSGQPQLSFRDRELAILATLSIYKAPYVRFAHEEMAQRAGLSPAQIAQACDGINAPDGLDEADAAIYRTSRMIAQIRAPLTDTEFEFAATHIDKQKLVGLAHLIMAYVWVCTLSNLDDRGVPSL